MLDLSKLSAGVVEKKGKKTIKPVAASASHAGDDQQLPLSLSSSRPVGEGVDERQVVEVDHNSSRDNEPLIHRSKKRKTWERKSGRISADEPITKSGRAMFGYRQPGFSAIDHRKLALPQKSCPAERDYLLHLTDEELMDQGQKTGGWCNLQWGEVTQRLREYSDRVKELRKENKGFQARLAKLKDAEMQEGTIKSLQEALEKAEKDLEVVKGQLDLSRVESMSFIEKNAEYESLVGRLESQVRELETGLKKANDELLVVERELERYTSSDDVVLTKATLRDYLLTDGDQDWLNKYLEGDGETVLYSYLSEAFSKGVESGIVQSVNRFAHLSESVTVFEPSYASSDMVLKDPQRGLAPLSPVQSVDNQACDPLHDLTNDSPANV